MRSFDENYCLKTFGRLLAADSTTGRYEEVQALTAAMLDELGVPYRTTHKGGLIADLGGAVSTVDKWGMKKFAYPINYKTEGYYVLMNFEAEPAVPAELERQMRNDENVVRFMVTKK